MAADSTLQIFYDFSFEELSGLGYSVRIKRAMGLGMVPGLTPRVKKGWLRWMHRRKLSFIDGNGNVRLEVLADSETVWLNRRQLAILFGRDVKTIGKHIANALKEELKDIPVVAKFATTAADGKVYQVEYYSIEMISSIGYRVKSPQGVKFRMWANGVLKGMIIRQATDKRLLRELEKRFADHEFRLSDVEKAMKYVLNTVMPALPANHGPIGFHE